MSYHADIAGIDSYQAHDKLKISHFLRGTVEQVLGMQSSSYTCQSTGLNAIHLYTCSTVQDWRIGTQACEDDEEILTEIMAPPSGGSSGMLQAVSIVPDGLDIELDFDCSSFGFWHDVGVDSYHPREGMTSSSGFRTPSVISHD